MFALDIVESGDMEGRRGVVVWCAVLVLVRDTAAIIGKSRVFSMPTGAALRRQSVWKPL